MLYVSATRTEAAAITRLGFRLERETGTRAPAEGDRHPGLPVGRLGLPRLRRDGGRAPPGASLDHPAIFSLFSIGLSYEGRDVWAGQDLRQRRHRRGRARGALHAPPARPRAPDRRDGALHCSTMLDRRLRHRSADHQPRRQPRDLDRLRHQPGRRRVRHRHRLLPLLAQEPPAQRRLERHRHRPEPQLGLQVGLLRRQQRHAEQRDLPRRRRPSRRPRPRWCATSSTAA